MKDKIFQSVLILFATLLTNCENKDKAVQTIPLEALDINKMEQTTDRPMVGSNAYIRIGEKKYKTGVYTRSDSYLYIDLNREGIGFSAMIGVDNRSTINRTDTVDKRKSFAFFYLYGDDGNKLLFKSDSIKYGQEALKVNVDIRGLKNILLKVTGGPGHTHVAWADAHISYSGEKPRTVWSPESKERIRKNKAYLLAQNERFPEPRINGAGSVGIKTGTPFLYRIPVTGMRPLSIHVTGLPKGLVYNESKQAIEGTVFHSGQYEITVTASNKFGRNERVLTVKAGEELALTPPMGYLSWNVVEGLINEIQMKETADALIELGLADVGYQYLVMDDCWQGYRDKEGFIHPDTVRFPDGLKKIGDYLHGKGLKFGLYSSPGPVTCGGYPGSYKFEANDVKTWCSWGVDYLKYDICSARNLQESASELYNYMGNLLAGSGRSVIYSLGAGDEGAEWGTESKGHLWRTAGDIRDTWSLPGRNAGIIECFEKQFPAFVKYQHIGAWNDPDMLLAGIYGKGSSANDLDAKGCSDTEYQAQMSLWALLSAPLFISADVRNISAKSLEILTNPEIIAVNQDALGLLPELVDRNIHSEIWLKRLEDNTLVLALLNLGMNSEKIVADWNKIGIKGSFLIRDLWKREDLGIFQNNFTAVVPPHGVTLVKLE